MSIDRADTTTSSHVPEDLPNRLRHYIDGAFVDSVSGATFDVLDPVSNETYVQAAAGDRADVDRAVAAARRAFRTRARARGSIRGHGPSSNARRAAATARSTSARSPAAACT